MTSKTAKEPIYLNVRDWNTNAPRNCIISVHKNTNIDGLGEISRFLSEIVPKGQEDKISEFFVSIRAFDMAEEKRKDYRNIEKLAKLLGYSGVEWEGTEESPSDE